MQNVQKQANSPLDAKEAARVLKMDSRTLVCWARRGYVPAHPLGEGKRRIWRFFEDELLEWVKNHENAYARRLPRSSLKIAIDAHAEEIA
jgi:predicted site-specific integrase-resolvase